jgi:hypothetical protein
MRNRTLIAVVLLLSALLLALLFAWWQKQSFNWRDDVAGKAYQETWEQPYGTVVVHRLLQQYFPERQFTELKKNLHSELPDSTAFPASYVFIGEAMYYDSLDAERLLHFVRTGNTALLISKSVPRLLTQQLFGENCMGSDWEDYAFVSSDTLAQLHLKHSTVQPTLFYAIKNEPKEYTWSYMEVSYNCTTAPFDSLGYLNEGLLNFLGVPFGKGHFLLHSTPLAFSNYQLLRPDMQAYAQEVLAELPISDVYWDACSRIPERESRKRNRVGINRQLPNEHVLAYILQQPALAWAWYLLLGMALSYLIFQAKRRQRIVPILPKNENSSYEFITTIANLHFKEKNYAQLCTQMMRLFLVQVRERYSLVASIDLESGTVKMDDRFLPRLAQWSEYPEENLRELFRQYAATVQFQPDETMMVDLHQAMESFWKHAK